MSLVVLGVALCDSLLLLFEVIKTLFYSTELSIGVSLLLLEGRLSDKLFVYLFAEIIPQLVN